MPTIIYQKYSQYIIFGLGGWCILYSLYSIFWRYFFGLMGIDIFGSGLLLLVSTWGGLQFFRLRKERHWSIVVITLVFAICETIKPLPFWIKEHFRIENQEIGDLLGLINVWSTPPIFTIKSICFWSGILVVFLSVLFNNSPCKIWLRFG